MSCSNRVGESNSSSLVLPPNNLVKSTEERAEKAAWTSEELYPLLEQNIEWIIMPRNLEALSEIIARISQDMLEHPSRYMVEGRRLQKGIYIDKNTRGKYLLIKTIWLKLMDGGERFRVQVYGKKIGYGAFKVIRESKTLEFSLLSGAKRLTEKKETVLVRSRKTKSFEGDSSHDDVWVERIVDTLKTMQTLFTSEERKKLNLGGVPEHIRKYAGKRGYKLEWEDNRYSGDFDTVSRENKVETGNSGKTVRFRMNDKCRILESVLCTLRAMHERGMVHGDVTPKNILLYFNPKTEQMDADLIDFDMISCIGFSWSRDKFSEFPFWDRYFQEEGIALPTTDLFGVTMSLASSVFGFDFLLELNERRKKKDYDQIEKLINSTCQTYVENIINQLLEVVEGTDEEKGRIKMFSQRILEIKQRTAQEKSGSNIDKIKEEIEKTEKASPNSKAIIRKYLAYCYVFCSMSELLWDMYQEDKKLYDFMTGTSEGKAISSFIQVNKKSLEKIREKLQEVYKICPLFTRLEERIKSIREGFETLHGFDKVNLG